MTLKRSFNIAAVLVLALSVTACSGMSHRGKNTAIGAGVGALGGVLTGGSTFGTLGGAAIGGLIGHEASR